MTTDPDPRVRFEASGPDLDDARRLYERAYDGTGFVADSTRTEPSYRFRSVGDDRMSFRSTRFDGRMRGEVDPHEDYIVTWTTQGGGTVDIGRDAVALDPGEPVVFPSTRPFVFDLADVRQSLVQFERGFLETVAAEHHGVEPGSILFDHAQRPAAGALQQWQEQVRSTATMVLGQGAVSALALAEASRTTALAMLRTFPHEVRARVPHITSAATGRVRRALEFMHAAAHTPISTSDVAAHVGLSIRGLQQAFQRQLGSAPNGVLRGIRLDRVRGELQAGRVGDVTVAEIAMRWGFAHLGRFSGAYSARFGEYPRDTLQG